jgi:hypothetical protein
MNRLCLLIRLFAFRELLLTGVAVSCFLMVGEVKSQSTEVTPRLQAHAHNDYLHERPLFDALDQGF